MDDERKKLEQQIVEDTQAKMELIEVAVKQLMPILHKYYWTRGDMANYIGCVENIARAHYECNFHFIDEDSKDREEN